ncbi:MAG TPA: 6-phosphogluconolactonase [Gaiellaceae bacterium]|nr:6-phosphogluconolactonase [Gaiellaceae bacterium]
MEIVVAEDPARLVAERLTASAGHVVLTGGSSPRRAYELASPEWSNTEIWWSDERCVAPDDDLSNYKLVKDSLLDRVTPSAVHRMQGELGRTAGADAYEEELAALERLDFALLGLGSDGHVASLFPNEPTLDVTDRKAVGAIARLVPFVDRITLTLPLLCSARTMVYLATGEDKADAVKRAFADEPSRATPASLVRGEETLVVLDAAAAALL